jgi:hypothetical protein
MAADAKRANAIPWYIKKAEPATPSWLHGKKTHSSPSLLLICFRFYCGRKISERAFHAHKLGAALLKYARSLEQLGNFCGAAALLIY